MDLRAIVETEKVRSETPRQLPRSLRSEKAPTQCARFAELTLQLQRTAKLEAAIAREHAKARPRRHLAPTQQ